MTKDKVLKLTIIKPLPEGWEAREGHDNEWRLIADTHRPQPLTLYIKELNSKVDYSGRNGYQATLGELAGRSSFIAPLRKTLEHAINDCVNFMEAKNDPEQLKTILNKNASFFPEGTPLKILYVNRIIEGTYREWLDLREEGGDQALLLDQSYQQHLRFVEDLYKAHPDKIDKYTYNHMKLKDSYEKYHKYKILRHSSIVRIEELK